MFSLDMQLSLQCQQTSYSLLCILGNTEQKLGKSPTQAGAGMSMPCPMGEGIRAWT